MLSIVDVVVISSAFISEQVSLLFDGKMVSLVLVLLVPLIRSEITSQLLGEVGGEVEVGEAEAEPELATELQLPVLRDKSVGSFSLATEPEW